LQSQAQGVSLCLNWPSKARHATQLLTAVSPASIKSAKTLSFL
jgi:hypothetical protein